MNGRTKAIFRPLVLAAFFCPLAPASEAVGPGGLQEAAARIHYRLTEYSIKASLPLIGDIGQVGTFAVEEEICRQEGRIDKSFRIYGSSKPDLAKKGKDYSGEMRMVRCLPLNEQEEIDWLAIARGKGVACTHTGFLKQNGLLEGENVVMYPQHAVSTRENGAEKQIEGNYSSFLAALEYLFEHDLRAGDVFESKSILDGRPCIFVCTTGQPVSFRLFGVQAFPVEIKTHDGLARDGRGNPLGKQKIGRISLWLSKEEPYKNRILRLKIHYKWYLTLRMDLVKAA